MRILIFHGYLLDGTGSNVYNARLAEALVRLGHEVHLLCQDRHLPERPFVDAAGDWDEGQLRVRPLRREVRCTAYRPDIGGLLPVYVADRYEGIEARTFAECSEEQVARYVQANVAAVRELAERVEPDIALANHLVMGPVIMARGLEGRVPFAVKVHGSALEYTVKPEPQRFLAYAREGVAPARAVLVGSRHSATSLWETLGDGDLRARTRLGPPGVDVARFAPREPLEAAAALGALAARLEREGARPQPQAAESAFARDPSASAAAIERLDPARDRLVAFVGKLIVSKGVDLLLAAWPLVLAREPRARLVVVGFGAFRAGLEQLTEALETGQLEQAREIAVRARALEGDTGARGPLRHLLAFLDGLAPAELERYLAAARELGERVVFTGRLAHEELSELLPGCEALVVPSTFPESFGMVAAEAAACGVLPISAAHSGLAELSAVLSEALAPEAGAWLSFPIDDHAVGALADRVGSWLSADRRLRADTRRGLVATARDNWSWEGVARGVIAAACGELEALRTP